ncbi:Hydrolase, alpha/beta fold family protein [Zostera marina]|uniref:Hydrolase, alpha/beta fold family protein n=1 Tax=Zostera marina TaxID=29655 RepID=A0A0K9PX23_ZOSMR|nr:Hydrolase, alpha/beta fold family protein [Zostera marina]
MPFCDVGMEHAGNGNGIRIYYRTYGYGRGTTKVLLINGLAGTHKGWEPQVKGLTGFPDKDFDFDRDFDFDGDEGIEVCCFDNRGMGMSSVPTKISEYTTTAMANDSLALLDHLGWKKTHVIGHSMGGMIACKLASMAPDRLSSLALLSTTSGGYECLPKIDFQMISIAFRLLIAKTPEQRAMLDLETRYTKKYLDEYVEGSTITRKEILLDKHVKKIISNSEMQSSYGFKGQVHACWMHRMTPNDLHVIRSAGFSIQIIHGRYDIVVQVRHARNLAGKLKPVATMVEFDGGHLVGHERPYEVNRSLLELIKISESKSTDNSESGKLVIKI